MNDDEFIQVLYSDNLIEINEDGYRYFWMGKGYLSAKDLRVIADELDKVNETWDKDIKEYFSNQEEL